MIILSSRQLVWLLVFIHAPLIGARSDSGTTSTIPRSTQRSPANADNLRYPPWNSSPNIDEHGFLMEQYSRVPGEWEKEFRLFKKRKNMEVTTPAQIRQVPGDGNCLFHSISTCYAYATNGTHIDLRDPKNLAWLYQNSARLREKAVECLEEKRKLLFLQGHEYLKAQDLVQAAALQYGISGEEYCQSMRQNSVWGGGPEIVALCNVLQRPIHVYELANEKNRFVLRRMACFGSPRFDRQAALHILSADSRFPDLTPGRQLMSGNHFLALFPKTLAEQKKTKKRAKLRGGSDRRPLDKGDEGVEEETVRLRRRILERMWPIGSDADDKAN